MDLAQKIKQYFWSIFGAIGIIAFWAGVWDGIGGLPFLQSPWISLLVGMAMLTFSGLIYKQFSPLEEMEKSVNDALHQVHIHPQKEEFHIKFHDRMLKKDVLMKAEHLRNIEKGFLVFAEKSGKEIFVPVHRVTEVLRKNKLFWKLK